MHRHTLNIICMYVHNKTKVRFLQYFGKKHRFPSNHTKKKRQSFASKAGTPTLFNPITLLLTPSLFTRYLLLIFRTCDFKFLPISSYHAQESTCKLASATLVSICEYNTHFAPQHNSLTDIHLSVVSYSRTHPLRPAYTHLQSQAFIHTHQD